MFHPATAIMVPLGSLGTSSAYIHQRLMNTDNYVCQDICTNFRASPEERFKFNRNGVSKHLESMGCSWSENVLNPETSKSAFIRFADCHR